MEFSSLSTPIILFLSLSTVVLLFVLYNRFFPEMFSRLRIRLKIAIYLYKKHYHLIEDIDIICANGHQLKIKQLLVSRYGLFIIETCHFRDTIYGSHHQVKWLSKGLIHSTPFRNPHMEQRGTIKLLADYFQLSPKSCSVMIVFTGNSHFPTKFPSNTCKIHNLIRTIVQHRNIRINPQLLPNMKMNLNVNKQSMLQTTNKLKVEV